MAARQSHSEQRQQLAAALHALGDSGLSPGSTGNASVRVDGGLLISPTGLACAAISPDQLVFIDSHGNCPNGQLRPSSEWHFHYNIYQSRADVGAVVHCHSRYATALACTRRGIPPYHYMVAAAGGSDIRCADYATFGTLQLADAVDAALQNRRACLLANHGQIALGDTPQQALDLAIQVEELAAGYCQTLTLGGPTPLSDAEMQEVLDKFSSYGKQNPDTP